MELIEEFLVALFTRVFIELLKNAPAVVAGVREANATTIVTAPPLPAATSDAINLELSHAILSGDVPAPGVVIHS